MYTRRKVWLFGFLSLMAALTASAGAHPLGNFTINHLAKVQANPQELAVRYVLDIAEIPTFQIMHAKSAGAWTPSELDAWAREEVSPVRDGLRVEIDRRAAPLALKDVRATLRAGAGGLPTLYWVADFTIGIVGGAHHVRIVDDVYADRRIGWKDVVVAPSREPTNELRTYPSALIGSPRRINAAEFDLASSGAVSAIVATSDEAPDVVAPSIVRSSALADLFESSDRTPFFIIFTALVAFGLGALHAIEPGHGKALLAFTLVGSQATVKQAAILAASLTFAHTIGVLLLGIVLFFAAGFVSESIYPWITLVSGVAVAVIGARTLANRLHAHDHAHAVPGSAPLGFRSAVVAAMSGGIAPCPAAIVVMLAALRLHQLGYGIALIVVFSMGLACVLTALGIAVVRGSAWVTRSRRLDTLVAAGPLISASLISVVGALMVAQGFVAQGVRAPVWVISALVVLAIAGYALTPQHAHGEGIEA